MLSESSSYQSLPSSIDSNEKENFNSLHIVNTTTCNSFHKSLDESNFQGGHQYHKMPMQHQPARFSQELGTKLRKAAHNNNLQILLSQLKQLNSTNIQAINEVDSSGRSPLMIASERGYHECVDILLRFGADLTLRSLRGMTPLIWASNRGHASCCHVLINNGADPNARDLHGATPLIYAAKYGSVSCVQTLVEAQCSDPSHWIDLNIQDKWGMTALLYAAREGYYECVEKLLEYGACISYIDKQGFTALRYAKTEEIVDLIECCEMTSFDSTFCL